MNSNRVRAIGFIFARGGSKGLPGKNVKALAGKPLIAHSIDVARACGRLETVIVSTDDDAIADAALRHGAEVPFRRPAELATDSAPEWLAWRHAIEWFEGARGAFDLFVSLPATSPFRDVADVNACIDAVLADPQADAAITVREAERSPYFNMVALGDHGYARLVMSSGRAIARRQDVPVVYDITTVAYVARPGFVRIADRLMAGKVRTVVVPRERSLDIDTAWDFRLAEMIATMEPTP